MNIYLRKILNHDITHQISITKEVLNDFFGVFEDREIRKMKGRHSGYMSEVSFLLATDPRFGGDIKTIINEEGGIKVGDILVFSKEKDGISFNIEVIRPSDDRYKTFNSAIENERHLIINIDKELLESQKEEENNNHEEMDDGYLNIERTPRTYTFLPLNFIIYGAPGTGKTYSTIDYALAIINNQSYIDFVTKHPDRKTNLIDYKKMVKKERIVFTTFHQNYGYEEFIQGLRPDTSSPTLAFKTVDGVFKKIADKALSDKDNNYVIIIDEINRANISKVFGELITLIEEDKRWGEENQMCATLQSGDIFTVPNNLYIIGTMNSADKSISLIDAALRRRFVFFEELPDSSKIDNSNLKAIFEKINDKLVDELDSTDLLVGHSYFMNKAEPNLVAIMNNNIIPLLYEYFYDNRKKITSVLQTIIDESSASLEIEDIKIGRLKVKEKTI